MVRRSTGRTRPELLYKPVAEYCVTGPSVSFRAKKAPLLREWKEKVRLAALSARHDSALISTAPLGVAITEFSESATKDRDNLAKPILDAMQGVFYVDDRQILQLHIDWCDINGSYVVRFMSPVVAAALSSGEEFLWIRIVPNRPKADLIS